MRPVGQKFVDALESVPLRELDQRFCAGSGALAGQGGERRQCQLRVGEREPALDCEPARPLRGRPGIGLWFAIEERETDCKRVLKTWRARKLSDDGADLVGTASLEGSLSLVTA